MFFKSSVWKKKLFLKCLEHDTHEVTVAATGRLDSFAYKFHPRRRDDEFFPMTAAGRHPLGRARSDWIRAKNSSAARATANRLFCCARLTRRRGRRGLLGDRRHRRFPSVDLSLGRPRAPPAHTRIFIMFFSFRKYRCRVSSSPSPFLFISLTLFRSPHLPLSFTGARLSAHRRGVQLTRRNRVRYRKRRHRRAGRSYFKSTPRRRFPVPTTYTSRLKIYGS